LNGFYKTVMFKINSRLARQSGKLDALGVILKVMPLFKNLIFLLSLETEGPVHAQVDQCWLLRASWHLRQDFVCSRSPSDLTKFSVLY
jgi:hypothetical protein